MAVHLFLHSTRQIMKQWIGIVVLLVVLITLVTADNYHEDHDGSRGDHHDGSRDHDNRCSTDIASSTSYRDCTAVTSFSLGVAGSTLSLTFCQSSDCYVFWSGLSTKSISNCLPGYTVGGKAVTDVSGMKDCFTNGGGLKQGMTVAPSIATTVAPTTVTTTVPTTVGTIPTTATTTSAPQTASSTAGHVSVTEKPTETTKPTTVNTTVSPSSTEIKSQLKDNNTSSSDSARPTTKMVESTRTTSGSSSVPNDKVIESSSNATTRGSREPSTNGEGSQSEPNGNHVQDKTTKTNSWVWILSAGCGIVLLLVVFLFMYIKRRAMYLAANKFDARHDDYVPTLESARSHSEMISVLGLSIVSNVSLPTSRYAFWDDEIVNAVRIPYEKLQFGALLSRGGYGEVHHGFYRDQPVAIKSLLPERRKDMRQIEKFIAEVKLMATLEHERIVQFIGVAWDSLNELCVVCEFMAGGDLRSLLTQFDIDQQMHPKGFTTGKITIAMHVAHALTYMHSLQPPVLHRDLKSRNVLLDAELNAKLTDFGVSRERVDSTMTIGVGSSLWMAPEVMTGGRYGEKADVFSFGVVLSELDIQKLPYSHALEPGTNRKLPDTVIVQMMTTGRITIQFSNETESPLAQLGRECVALNPDDRPTAAELQHRIHQLWRNPKGSFSL